MGNIKPGGEPPMSLVGRFVRACLLVLLGMFVLWLALQLLGQIWGWLLLLAATVCVVWAVVRFVRWRRDGRW